MTVEKMRGEMGSWSVAFKIFTEQYKKYPGYAFCFYEGEDGKYFDSRIQIYWGPNFHPIIANCKENVLKVMERIKRDPMYSSICTMFFVDRDFDQSLAGTNADLFETPCYSIENLYANESTLAKILKAEFCLNEFDSIYNTCMDRYRRLSKEFNEIAYKFNALFLCQRKYAPKISANLGDTSVDRIAVITLDNISESSAFDKLVRKKLDEFGVGEKEFNKEIQELRTGESAECKLRGKQQLDFMVKFIMLLKDANDAAKKNPNEFFNHKIDRVRINISPNRLSEISQYAYTPEELIAFLKSHRPARGA